MIDESLVCRSAHGTTTLVVGDEAVLVDEAGRATAISATGALIWSCLDPAVRLSELVDELSASFGHERAAVAADVLGFVTDLGRLGLLEGRDPAQFQPGAELPFSIEPVEPPAVGDEVPDFVLGDLDGSAHALSSHRGREVLLVHWNPDCGYCALAAPLLARGTPALRERGVDLLLVASGTAAANRALCDTARLRARVLLLEHGDAHPFAGYGTPAAYHVDAEGRLATTAFGATDVSALAARLAGLDPRAPDTDRAPGVRYLLDERGMCAPRANPGPTTSWAATAVYRLGEYHVGLRSNSKQTEAVLDALFPERVDDPAAGHSYSIVLHDPAQRRSSPVSRLNLLVQGGEELVRSRTRGRILRALLARLTDDIVGFDATSGRIRVRATAATFDGAGVLLPDGLVRFRGFEPRFARAGITLADTPHPEIDLRTAELVIPELAVEHRPEVLVDYADISSLGSEQPCVAPGRYQLAAWYLQRLDETRWEELSPAAAAVGLLPSVLDTVDVPARIEELGELFARVPAFAISYHSEAGMVEAVIESLRRGQ